MTSELKSALEASHIMCYRAFSCAGPSAWNSVPEYMTVDTLTLDYFKRSLKCFLFARYWHSAWSALGICNDSALYKCTLNNNNNNNIQIDVYFTLLYFTESSALAFWWWAKSKRLTAFCFESCIRYIQKAIYFHCHNRWFAPVELVFFVKCFIVW